MASLNDYLRDCQRLLREKNQDLLSPDTLKAFINRARREIALRTKCVRILTPISGPVVACSVVQPGSGYHAGTTQVVISPPDFPSGTGAHPSGAQAFGAVILSAGGVVAVDITYGGDGYFQPTATILDASTTPGTGAVVTTATQPINILNASQEVYPFSGVDLTRNPGAQSVYAVKGISIIYANYRYSLPVYAFSVYQSMVRQYPFQYQYVPTFASQYGQGTAGSFYVYPLPSQTYQYELDCFVLPSDLTTDLSPEILPDPWTDAVVYFANHLAMMTLQNYNVSKYYLELFEKMCLGYSNYARPGTMVNPYGRY
jgi:hypothetical protein